MNVVVARIADVAAGMQTPAVVVVGDVVHAARLVEALAA